MKRLIVSFIGDRDIKYLPPQGEDMSPILRLLIGLPGGLRPERTRLMLFDDDVPPKRERLDFCARLEAILPELGLAGLTIDRHPIAMPAGPTDMNCLYEVVWAAIPKSGKDCADEVVFHFSSGTASMQATLLLAANCLRLDRVRVIETSRQYHVLEMRLPYVLAARDIREQERARARPGLDAEARKTLLPETVIDDPLVEAAYAALHKAVVDEKKRPARVLVRGPEGSGKATATPDLPAGATVLIRHLDTWPVGALARLTLLAAERPDLAIVATLRTDRPQVAPPEVLASEGLRGAGQVELPALGVRGDVAALGESLARQLGLKDGLLKERFQHEWLTDVFPRNLHDLKSLLATADLYGPHGHPDRAAYRQARHRQAAEHRLAEAWQALAAMDFGPGRPSLDERLAAIRAATVQRVSAQGRTQQETGDLLGLSRSTVQAILGTLSEADRR